MNTKKSISDNTTIRCNFVIKNAKIISPLNKINDVSDIKIENGIITAIEKNIKGEGIDYEGKIIIPGLVDMHCHLREPGFEYKETIESGIKSAIAGGFTAICPMANTNPAVDNIDTLKYTIKKADNNIGFFPICAVSKGLKGKELTNIKELKSSGAIAFSDDGNPLENLELLKSALKTRELIISHAEDSKLLTAPESEAICVQRELEVLRAVGGRIHFAHISTKKALEHIKKAKKEGLNVTCETAPHYFYLTKESVTSNGQFKMNPPLRTKEDLNAVLEGLKDDTIDCIATDHAPHSLEEKNKSFDEAPFGIVGFETALSAGLKLVHDGHISLNKLIEKMSVNPAKILNLKDYGSIKIGQSANLTIIDTDIIYTVRADEFESKCKITPFEGIKMKGKTIATVINGDLTETGKKLCKQ